MPPPGKRGRPPEAVPGAAKGGFAKDRAPQTITSAELVNIAHAIETEHEAAHAGARWAEPWR